MCHQRVEIQAAFQGWECLQHRFMQKERGNQESHFFLQRFLRFVVTKKS